MYFKSESARRSRSLFSAGRELDSNKMVLAPESGIHLLRSVHVAPAPASALAPGARAVRATLHPSEPNSGPAAAAEGPYPLPHHTN